MQAVPPINWDNVNRSLLGGREILGTDRAPVVCMFCPILQAIRAAADGPAAKAALVSRFALSEAQAEGVLAMTLRSGLPAGC